jgi:hypothetical protein
MRTATAITLFLAMVAVHVPHRRGVEAPRNTTRLGARAVRGKSR